MRVIIQKDYDKVSAWTASYIVKRINEANPTPEKPFVLGLPTGSTPIGTYKKLIEKYENGEVSFRNVVTFNMDEYCNIPRNHSQSYYSFMWDNFFSHIDIVAENTNILDGNAVDPAAMCEEFEKKIERYGGIDLFLGGVGGNGHIAFNEPGSSLTSRTRVKVLTYETRLANSRFFDDDIDQVPELAVTVGVGTVMDAKEVIILATGSAKAVAFKEVVEGSVSHMIPVSTLQMHRKGIIVCDEEAASEIKVGTYKYFKDIEHKEII